MAIVPAVLAWLFVRRRDLARFLPAVALGAAIGFLPVLISNLRNDWWSRDIGHPGNTLWYPGRLWQLFSNTLPIALDLRTAVTLHWFAWKPIALLVYAAAIVGSVWLWRRSRPGREFERAEVLLVIAAVFPFVYAMSPLTSIGDIPGYVVVFMPVLALLLTAWIRTTAQAVAVAGVCDQPMAGATCALRDDYATRDAARFRTSVPMSRFRAIWPAYDELDRLGIQRVYAATGSRTASPTRPENGSSQARNAARSTPIGP